MRAVRLQGCQSGIDLGRVLRMGAASSASATSAASSRRRHRGNQIAPGGLHAYSTPKLRAPQQQSRQPAGSFQEGQREGVSTNAAARPYKVRRRRQACCNSTHAARVQGRQLTTTTTVTVTVTGAATALLVCCATGPVGGHALDHCRREGSADAREQTMCRAEGFARLRRARRR